MSAVLVTSLVFQLLFLVGQEYLPPLHPVSMQRPLRVLISGIALVCTFLHIALYPVVGLATPLVVTTSLVVFSAIPPLAGLIESKSGPEGQSTYSTGVIPGTKNRFPGHLLTNILGALAVSAFLWVAHSTTGFTEFVAEFRFAAAFNIMLPLSMIAVFAFARWQQVDFCPKIDEAVEHSGWEAEIRGFSLRHWHQVTNVLYLIAAVFTATTTFSYLVAYAMERAKTPQPLLVSWQVVLTVLVTLGFFFACGGPWSRENKAVYLTFVTGAPAALGGAIVWLSWFRHDVVRDTVAVSIVGIGYVLYCVEVVLAGRANKRDIHLHYFAATGVAVVLAAMLGALYLSK